MKTLGKIMMPLIPIVVLLSIWLGYEYSNILYLFGSLAYVILAMVVYYKYNPIQEGDVLETEDEVDMY